MMLQLYSALNLLWFLCNSAVINFCQFTIWLLVRPFDNALYRRLMGSYVQSLWVDVASSCFPEAKLVVTGEIPTDKTRPAIIIANHQVDADWWYIWQAARAYKGAGNIKIVLKDQLKYVPIIGWGMRLFEFLFLRRSIDHDSKHIKAYMDSLIGDDYPFWLVIFPEGTTIHKEYVVKSQAFAEKLNRPKFNRVLLPRTSGLQIILDAVDDVKPDIYDMTIAFPTYSGEVPTFDMGYGRERDIDVPSMKSLLAGQGPKHAAIHSKKYSYEEVTQNLEQFLDTRWKEKEERLNYFIKHQQFPVNNEAQTVLSLPSSIVPVFRLWFLMTLSFFMLPVIMMSFFPLYTIWVVYCFVYSIYDRTTNFWWPYILNLILGRTAKTREEQKLKKKQ
uniref:Phospholipid/glycerol acyltransferase domain-containing protein n=1 Tax=Globisporangium ultimum (strain ATCC 200006 / CBS 805.95 / DAOM BR144) TaxID=431595 RepID=K3X6I6_GLOUD